MRVWSLGREDPLEEEMATHSSILAWKIPWTEEPGGLQSMGSQRWLSSGAHTVHTHWRKRRYACFCWSSRLFCWPDLMITEAGEWDVNQLWVFCPLTVFSSPLQNWKFSFSKWIYSNHIKAVTNYFTHWCVQIYWTSTLCPVPHLGCKSTDLKNKTCSSLDENYWLTG